MVTSAKPSVRERLSKKGLPFVLAILIAALALWSTLAIYYSNLPASWLRTLAAAGFASGTITLFLFVRSSRLARLIFCGAFAVVVVWFLLIPASNDRHWQPDVAILPYAEVQGNRVTIHHIRNCAYHTETNYTLRHYDKTFDLDQLQSVDLYVVYWGSPFIAHTMLSFGFATGDYPCFSIETRKQQGQQYSAIKGFFRQFELTYVIGDERDLVRLRTNFRNEQVYLYRLKIDPPVARMVFLDYLKEVNHLKDRPEWYNALTSNCTTNIRGHTYPYAKKSRWDWRMLINGYVDQLAYQIGSLDRSLPFGQLKTRSLINARARALDNSPQFSSRIREGLPGFPL